jgi:threonine dehydrogenase-like Zn-dependent dehydrogenase
MPPITRSMSHRERRGSGDTIAEAVRLVARVARSPYWESFPALLRCWLAMVVKEVRLIGAMLYDRTGSRPDFDIALELLEQHRDLAAALITHRLGLDAIQSAFETASDRRGGAIKVTVAP